MKSNLFALIGAALLVSACSSTDSTGLATNQIKAIYHGSIDSHGSGSFDASADFYKEDDALTSVHLEGGDTISATTDKDPSLAFDYDSNLVFYSAHLTGMTDRTTISFILNRGSNGTSTSTVAFPGAIALTAPLPMAIVPYAGGTGNIDFTWTNPIDQAEMKLAGFPSCDDGAVQATTTTATGADTGTISVPMSKLFVGPPAAGGQCITVLVSRMITGIADAALAADSTIDAERREYVKIVIMP